jgi:hypothetical protein
MAAKLAAKVRRICGVPVHCSVWLALLIREVAYLMRGGDDHAIPAAFPRACVRSQKNDPQDTSTSFDVPEHPSSEIAQ